MKIVKSEENGPTDRRTETKRWSITEVPTNKLQTKNHKILTNSSGDILQTRIGQWKHSILQKTDERTDTHTPKVDQMERSPPISYKPKNHKIPVNSSGDILQTSIGKRKHLVLQKTDGHTHTKSWSNREVPSKKLKTKNHKIPANSSGDILQTSIGQWKHSILQKTD